jgi:outer membrane lipoprotein LolB
VSVRWWIPAVVLLAAGCAVAPQRPPVADPGGAWRDRQAALAGLDRWDINGSLGVHSGEKSGQANIVWVRRGESNRINLFGPFGAGRVILTQNADGARLQDSKHHDYTAATAQKLLFQTYGWDVPFRDLKYWVLGLPAPGASRELVLDPWGRLASLQQGGWEVRIPEYKTEGNLELPRKVFLRLLPDGSGGARTEVRLVIRRWGTAL